MNTTNQTTDWENGFTYGKEITSHSGNVKHRNARVIWYEGEDGWWAILKDGLVIDDCVGVHEETKAKLLSRLNEARPGIER